MASLKDIAAELNVSISLVSKVLNNRMSTTNVTPQVAEAIRKKADELNYQKNASAFSLSTGCHDTIGVFIHRYGQVGSGLLERLVMGVAEKAREKKQKLILAFFETADEFIELSSAAHRGAMDGLIIAGLPHSELAEQVYEIAQNKVPVITVQNEPMHPDIPNISMSEESIGYVATRHLIGQGCRSIGHIRTREMKLRYTGYCKAMREAGLKIDSSWIFDAKKLGFSSLAGEAFARKILNERIPLDGLVAESDHQAAGAMNVFQAASVHIPDNIKLIGVDNAPFCELLPVQLSSVSQKTVTKGTLAIDMMMRLRAGQAVESITLEPELKIRRSSGGE
jgi:LacI family transcriptional regulator